MPGDLDAMTIDTSFLRDYRPGDHNPTHTTGPDGGRHGGSGPGSSTLAAGPGSPDPPVPREPDAPDPPAPEHDSPSRDQPAHPEPEPEPELPLWQDQSDHQDAVQQLTTRGGASSGGPPVLPKTGFHVAGQDNQPQFKALPPVIVAALRGQVRAAAVRELGATGIQATEFSEKLSHKALVIAFLAAQLDLRVEADPGTQCATQLFRTRDPLLGSIATRMERLEQAGHDHAAQLEQLRTENAALQATAAVIEHAAAYSITERAEGLLRGVNTIADVPYTDRRVLQMRDRAREETAQQTRIDKERDGRPRR